MQVDQEDRIHHYDSAHEAARTLHISTGAVYRYIGKVHAPDGSKWYYKRTWEQLGREHKWAVYPDNQNYEASMEGEVRQVKTKLVL